MIKIKNNIVIFGCGRLGSNIANILYDEGNDVTVIDKEKNSFKKLSLTYGGEMIEGDGANIELLESLSLNENTLAIVVTNRDNVNIMIAQLLKEKFKVKKINSRLYDPERDCVYEEFGINVICPTDLATARIKELI